MKCTLFVCLMVLTSSAHADENLAKKIGFPKNFDPVAAVPKADRLEGDPRFARPGRRGARDLLREKEELWNHVLPWQNTPEAIGMGGHGAQSPTSQKTALRAQRAARARARKAAIIANYGAIDAGNAAADAANISWGMRFVGHY